MSSRGGEADVGSESRPAASTNKARRPARAKRRRWSIVFPPGPLPATLASHRERELSLLYTRYRPESITGRRQRVVLDAGGGRLDDSLNAAESAPAPRAPSLRGDEPCPWAGPRPAVGSRPAAPRRGKVGTG